MQSSNSPNLLMYCLRPSVSTSHGIPRTWMIRSKNKSRIKKIDLTKKMLFERQKRGRNTNHKFGGHSRFLTAPSLQERGRWKQRERYHSTLLTAPTQSQLDSISSISLSPCATPSSLPQPQNVSIPLLSLSGACTQAHPPEICLFALSFSQISSCWSRPSNPLPLALTVPHPGSSSGGGIEQRRGKEGKPRNRMKNNTNKGRGGRNPDESRAERRTHGLTSWITLAPWAPPSRL